MTKHKKLRATLGAYHVDMRKFKSSHTPTEVVYEATQANNRGFVRAHSKEEYRKAPWLGIVETVQPERPLFPMTDLIHKVYAQEVGKEYAVEMTPQHIRIFERPVGEMILIYPNMPHIVYAAA